MRMSQHPSRGFAGPRVLVQFVTTLIEATQRQNRGAVATGSNVRKTQDTVEAQPVPFFSVLDLVLSHPDHIQRRERTRV